MTLSIPRARHYLKEFKLDTFTVLDPTCGSGAFLFAALNILEPLYEACLDRMQGFIGDLDLSGAPHRSEKFSDFRKILTDVGRHPNLSYFILKSIIVNNLYGVDIMEEAIEICKLRLFLKLVAQVDKVKDLEPLPDIDFNIRPGNTLVGFAAVEDVKRTLEKRVSGGMLPLDKDEVDRIIEDAEIIERAYRQFHAMQTAYGMDAREFSAAKKELTERLRILVAKLNDYLAGEYGIDHTKKKQYQLWLESHLPFHWCAEFYGIMNRDRFDVIIGNPPYVEYSKVSPKYGLQNYATGLCGNLYAFVLERCDSLMAADGRFGMIVPLSLLCTDRMKPARDVLNDGSSWVASFDMRPSSLFEGVAQRLCILFRSHNTTKGTLYTGGYRRWAGPEREHLLHNTQFVSQEPPPSSALPKVSDQIELNILAKSLRGQRLNSVTDDAGRPIYVHRICRYFIKAVDFVPLFIDSDGNQGRSEDYKPFCFRAEDRSIILGLINSSLFYWFWRVHGDGFHCGYGDVYEMPLPVQVPKKIRAEIERCGAALMSDLQKRSARKFIKTKRGRIEYQEFYPRLTKPIIDLIDRSFSVCYQLTEDELDYILNYDLKYRLGSDQTSEDD